MQNYRVMWEIDIEADSPKDAAQHALLIQQDQDSAALVFSVTNEDGDTIEIDLLEEDN